MQDIAIGRTVMSANLLFAAGRRPDAQAIGMLTAQHPDISVSFDPARDGSAAAEGGAGGTQCWVELLASGLTFDLADLAPGRPAPQPPRGHVFGLPTDIESELLEVVTLRPGPHLAGAGGMMPVIRMLALLAAQLADLPGVRAVAWPAARSWCGPEHFRDMILRWTEGGAFPAFGLTALVPMTDGGMQSEGLAMFTGQELRLEPELVRDPATSGRIGAQLLHHLVRHGRLDQPLKVDAGDGSFRLEPSANSRFVRAWRG